MHSRLIVSALLLTAFSATSAQASGSGSYPSGGSPTFPETIDPYRQAYDSGRRTFKREITCKKCPFAEGVKDRETAFAVIDKLETGEIVLSEEKTANLVLYLDRRFKLRSAN